MRLRQRLVRTCGVLLLIGAVYLLVFPISLPRLSTLDQPPIRQQPNGHFMFERAWSFSLDGQPRTIPLGYTSNGITASLRTKQWLGGNCVSSGSTRAAIMHDWFILRTDTNRFTTDKILYSALRQGETPWWKSKLMYHAVSLRSLKLRCLNKRHSGENSPPWTPVKDGPNREP